MTQNTQHTPAGGECRSSHINANATAALPRTFVESEAENTRDKSAINVSSVAQQKLSEIGCVSSSNLLPPTAELAVVAASLTHNFLQSITREEMATSIGRLGYAGINFINSFVDRDSREETIDCFVSIVIALAANSVNAHTRNRPSLIAAAPDLLEALQDLMKDIVGGQPDPHGTMKAARAAIAKATGQAA